jgi:aminopeptidase N
MEDEIAEMIDWMSDLFGPYPFETFGFVTVTGFGGALETQTMVVLSEEAIDKEGTLAHEITHMWFGDWVSIDSWGDIWRSEGFATYVSYMWFARDDPEELEHRMASLMQDVQDSGYPLDDPPPSALFAGYSYTKGAIVVHALRQEMGDEAFFSGLRAYFERYGGGTATHAEFQAVLEEACGFSLDSFFEEWLE